MKVKEHLIKTVAGRQILGTSIWMACLIRVSILSLLFVCCVTLRAKAQSPKEILGLAIDRQGDWSDVTNLRLRMSSLNGDRWQVYDYDQLIFQRDKWELKIDVNSGDFVNHTVGHYPGGYIFDTYRLGLDSTYWVYDGARSRTGNALIDLGKELYVRKSKSFLLSFFPYYILKSACNLKELSADTINNWIVIRSQGQEYWLNRSNFLLEKSVTIRDGVVNAQSFQNYVEREHLMIPGQSSFSVDGKIYSTDSLSNFKINLSKDSLGLKLPLNYVHVKEYNGPPQVRKVSKTTYLMEKIDSDRNIIFRDMGNYILLTEAPVSAEVVKQIIGSIAAKLPGKPVKYVHLSHFHQDHIAGITELLRHGVSIICTPETAGPVKDLIRQSSGSLDKKQEPRFILIRKELSIGQPGNNIKFYAINNSHAKGMSFAFLPKEELIFQGDLLSLPEDKTITPAIQVNNEFFKEIRRLKLQYKLIVAHHGLSTIDKTEILKMDKQKLLNMGRSGSIRHRTR